MSDAQKKQNFLQGTALLAMATAIVKVIGAIYKIPLQNIIGKTGTSRQVIDPRLREGSLDPYQDKECRRQYSSTFAGFFPADKPRYSVICVLFTKYLHL